jgi:hypothetical protein
MANTFVKIQTVTVGSGGAANIEFTSIPQTYTDLIIKTSIRNNETSAIYSNINLEFNGLATAIYSARRLYGTGGAAGSDSYSGLTSAPGGWVAGPSATASVFSNGDLYIPNYTSSNSKSFSWDSLGENNAVASISGISAGLAGTTAAITSIKLSTGSTILQYSTATLYGIKSS